MTTSEIRPARGFRAERQLGDLAGRNFRSARDLRLAVSSATSRARRALEGAGRRLTPRRAAILGYLAGVRTHPTAETVYQAVRRRQHGLGLATVYTALEALVAAGLAARLDYGDGAARYDIRTDPHAHARCLVCGAVTDLEALPGPTWLAAVRATGFQPAGLRVEITGRCRSCRRAAASTRHFTATREANPPRPRHRGCHPRPDITEEEHRPCRS